MTVNLLEKELQRTKEEKRRCAELYSDWKDDKYNCGPNKFIWGLTVDEKTAESFEDLTTVLVYYNRDTKNYFLQLDLEMIKDLGRAKLLMLFWLQGHAEKITRNDIYSVDSTVFNDGIPFRAATLSELYLQFRIFVNGYLDVKEESNR
jgi:hypothetical protein